MKLIYTASSQRDMKKLSKDVSLRILDKMDYWMDTVFPLRFAEPLTGSLKGYSRYRIGDYRVVVSVSQDTLYVVRVIHRKEVYKKL